jgi:hypothetical protein
VIVATGHNTRKEVITRETTRKTSNQVGGDNQASNSRADEFDVPYFSEKERERLRRWRAICAKRPELTREQIESVGALLRTLEQRRNRGHTATPNRSTG